MKSLLILVVDDEEALRKAIALRLKQAGHRVSEASGGREALQCLETAPVDVVLLDVGLPDMNGVEVLRRIRQAERPVEAILITANATLDAAVAGARDQAVDFLIKPVDFAELARTLERAARRILTRKREDAFRDLVLRGSFFPDVIAQSTAMQEALGLVMKAADSGMPILFLGQTGTGKDLLARTMHLKSRRAQEPFIAINCASVRESLLESELFGHEKGAFTGADALKRGHFEVADGGTLFLDEVGEMPLSTQSAFLRVLENGEIRRVGGSQSLVVDVRVVAATNRNLEAEVKAGRFRKDLFFRLNALTIRVPSLRERRQDIAGLVEYFSKRLSPRVPKRFTAAALSCLERYPWPGNVRELRNVVERISLLARSDEVRTEDLPEEIQDPDRRRLEPATESHLSLKDIERRHIARVLDRVEGNKAEAARRLGITKATLYRKLQAYGLRVEKKVSDSA